VQKNKVLVLGFIVMLLITLALSGCLPVQAPEGEAEEGGTSSTAFLVIMLVLIFGMFYFLMIRPQRRRQKEHDQLMEDLKKGEDVVTVGGIYGKIESLSQESVILKLESGTTIRVARGSIAGKRPK